MDDFDIDLGEAREAGLREKAPPTHDEDYVAKLMGRGEDHPGIFMRAGVFRNILRHAGTDTGRELAGVLLGEVHTHQGGLCVRISASLEARFTESHLTNVKFTHATWQDLMKTKDASYPELDIVGWYHTHPGLGIFLSGHDLFIHRNFF